MNGKYFYFAIAALLGVLTSLYFFLPFLILTVIYLYLLSKYKKYSKLQLTIVICLFITFFLTSQHAVTNNKTSLSDSLTTFYVEYTENTKVDGDLLQVTARDLKSK